MAEINWMTYENGAYRYVYNEGTTSLGSGFKTLKVQAYTGTGSPSAEYWKNIQIEWRR